MGKKVLLMDDSGPTLRMMSRILELEGYRVDTALHGLEGLEKIRGGEKFDVILSDMNMPEMDGLAFAEELKHIPHYKDVPLIIISSNHPAVKENRNRAGRVSAWILKPFKKNELLDAVKKVCI